MTVDAISYPTDKPSVIPTSSLIPTEVNEWLSFIETSTKPAGTEIYYQLSDDDGATWQWWDGVSFVAAGAADYNVAADINANISEFPITNGKILFKAFLESDGTQTPRLNNLRIDYQGESNTINCVKDWTFDTAGNYSYDPVFVQVTGGQGKLLANGIDFIDDDEADFDDGVYAQTEYDTDYVQLSAGQTSGTYTSSVKDAIVTVDWQTIEWTPDRPVGKELPDNKQTETAYSEGNVDMTNNRLLLHLDETSGVIQDSSGEGNNGTDNGGIIYAQTGKFNSAIEFDGIDDYIQMNDDMDLVFGTGNNAWTYTGWINPSVLNTAQSNHLTQNVFMAKASDPSNDNLEIGVTTANNLHVYIDTDVNDAYADFGGGELTTGSWHFVAVRYDSGTVDVWLDGTNYQNTTTWAGSNNLDGATGSPVTIGATTHIDTFFNGFIDELAIFDRALTDTEVTDIFKRGLENLRFQVRSCDDSSCSGEAFIGPDGTGSTYYSELSNGSLGLPVLPLTNVDSNRFFQYKSYFNTDDSAYSPKLYDVSITTNGSLYPTDSPSLQPASTFTQADLYELTGFEETATKQAGTEIYYQLSDDDGVTWKWWNGASWADRDEGIASDANTIALWHLNNTADDVMDSSSNLIHGTNNGAIRGASGQYGNAFEFDGLNDYIDIPYNAALNLVGSDFTIDFWIKTTDADGIIIKKYTGSAGFDSWGIRINSGIIEFYDGSSWISGGITVNTGEWKHIAITGDDSSNKLEFFENGESMGTQTFGNITANTQNIFIGSDLASNHFEGFLDEIRISDSIRTDEEIFVSIWLSNLASEIATNIENFPVLTDDIMFKALLKSDGAGQVSLDNVRLNCTYSINELPSATVPINISQKADGSGFVTFETTVSDIDNEDTRLMVEYSDDGGLNWYKASIDSASVDSGSVSVNNSVTYQIGEADMIDTNAGDVTLTIVWDTQSVGNGNGSLDDLDLTDVQLRVIPNDLVSNGLAAVSASFEVDNLDPAGLATFAALSETTHTLTWSFDSVTVENNFNHYEVWYGTNQAEVETRSGGAAEWDDNNDANLGNMSASSTTIGGLTSSTKYFAKVWAVDDFGNEMTTTIASNRTSETPSSSGSSGGGGGSSSGVASSSFSTSSEEGDNDGDSTAACLSYMENRDLTFIDLPENHWAWGYMEFLKKVLEVEGNQYVLNGYLVNENSNTAEVGPDNNVKRYELIKMVLVSNCIPIPDDISYGTVEFSDISRELDEDEGTNFVKRVMYTALDEGIISGYADDFSAKPWNDVNRAEAIKIILNGAGIDIEGNYPDVFNDVNLDSWFRQYVLYAYDKGIVKGYLDDPGNFHPEETMTRGQSSKVIALSMPLAKSPPNDIKETVLNLFKDEIPYDLGKVLGVKTEKVDVFISKNTAILVVIAGSLLIGLIFLYLYLKTKIDRVY